MRPTDDIEKSIKKLRFKASTQAHSRILDNILQSLESGQKPTVPQPNIWKIIMKSRITKLAVAAVVIVISLLGIFEFRISGDGDVSVAGIAWARVEEALEEVSCVHMIANGRWRDMKDYTERELWRDNESRISITKSYKRVILRDFRKGLEYQYNPKTNEIIIFKVTGTFALIPLQFQEYVEEISHRYADVDISHRQDVLDGSNVKVFELNTVQKNGVRREYEFYVDAESDLPLISHGRTLGSDGAVLSEVSIVYEYPQEGPATIYDVGVPQSATVYDYSSKDLEVPADMVWDISESADKLLALGEALLIYSNDHDEQYPDNLQDLEDYLEDLQWFTEKVEYLGKGKKASDPPDTVIAYDKSMMRRAKGTNVLYNAHVAFEKPLRLVKLGIFYYR